MTKTIYYLCGHGGRITNGLGKALNARGYDLVGRETVGEFKSLEFSQQVDLIANDIEQNFWHEDAQVIANSYGGYLFLHAQAQLKPFIGRVMLLSPIVGEFSSEEIRMGFIPPYSKRLFELASQSMYPTPIDCEIHVGSEDWQSNPSNVTDFADLLGIKVNIVQNGGHSLDKDYVSQQLDRWLK